MELRINDEYTILDEGYGYELIRNGEITDLVKYEDGVRIYNRFYELRSELTSVKANKKGFVAEGRIFIQKNTLPIEHSDLYLEIAGRAFELEWSGVCRDLPFDGDLYSGKNFRARIPMEGLLSFGANAPVYIVFKDKNGFGGRKSLKWELDPELPICDEGGRFPKASRSSHPRPKLTAYLRQTKLNNVYLSVHEPNRIDNFWENHKMRKAYRAAMKKRAEGGTGCILMFEKKSQKYEESGSIVFEKIIDNAFEGMKPVYFVLSKDSVYRDKVPEKYRKYIVEQYSYKHYFLFFYADVFLSSEFVQHGIEYHVKDPLARGRILGEKYRYIFLQHGVYYIKGITEADSFIIKGKSFPRYGRMVVSSETEAKHITDYAHMPHRDLYITGFPKFDRSKLDEQHDLIVIMPTYRKWEINMYEDDPTSSSYYKYMLNIYNAVPDKLKEKTVILTHPLVRGKFDNTPLGRHILTDVPYDDILRKTELMITDVSSVSYDAFYRGSKVIFCWEEKEYFAGMSKMWVVLNDDNVFADVSYSFDDLPALIERNYYGPQRPEHIAKFRDIVAYNDGHNTDRLFEALKRDGYLCDLPPMDISECEIHGITKKLYTGKPLTLKELDVTHGTAQLREGIDYEVEYTDNIKAGMATVTIRGIGRNHGEKSEQFLSGATQRNSRSRDLKTKNTQAKSSGRPSRSISMASCSKRARTTSHSRKQHRARRGFCQYPRARRTLRRKEDAVFQDKMIR
ncbi:MAG: CDP-glycerol glycerophosphotransferase family protein [Ruminococcus sp.]|nr:CDP-glycerol glycerophosphotransferase family protein [Ruminococcus sp.]